MVSSILQHSFINTRKAKALDLILRINSDINHKIVIKFLEILI